MNSKIIISIAGILIVAAAVVLIIKFTDGDNNSETTVMYCGPNKTNPVLVFRNPTKAFPAFAQDYNLNLKTGLQTLAKLNDSLAKASDIDISVKRQITELRERLNQDNIQFENVLKSAFFAYNQHPCDGPTSTMYLSLVKDMADKVLELQKLKSLPDTIAKVKQAAAIAVSAKVSPRAVDLKKDSLLVLQKFWDKKLPDSLIIVHPANLNIKSYGTKLAVKYTLTSFEKSFFKKE